ncbi:hypoxanthine phosphoribosyltransferase [Spiroplasma endosymbiont of Tricholauxania praeusta]|uniref:hypoxanthine phosphoribosyltransferase n=1 Tax=Spiroplasma endosymbiont of Tricholauxania praeusta TaxID=3066296 RepID=UPI0030CFC5AF
MLEKHELVEKILLSTDVINNKIIELAKSVNSYYKDNKEPIILVGILRGCLPFLSQFMLNLKIDCFVDFMYVESYLGQTKAVNKPKIRMDVINNVKGRDLLIVEDIIDSGNSLFKIRDHLQELGAKSVKIITLLDKKSKRVAKIEADWYGFEVPDHFLVGYGLDYDEKLRNLPYVGIADLNKIAILEKCKKVVK